jgi:hypothetical protein
LVAEAKRSEVGKIVVLAPVTGAFRFLLLNENQEIWFSVNCGQGVQQKNTFDY